MNKPDKRGKYDEAFKAEALRVARESRSTQVNPGGRSRPQPSPQTALRMAKGRPAAATR